MSDKITNELGRKINGETATVTLETQSNYTVNDIRVRKVGGLLNIYLSVTPVTPSNQPVVITNLPSGYRVQGTYNENRFCNSDGSTLGIIARNDGRLQVYEGNAGKYYLGNITMPLF